MTSKEQFAATLMEHVARAALDALEKQHAATCTHHPDCVVPFQPTKEDVAAAIAAGVTVAILAVLPPDALDAADPVEES